MEESSVTSPARSCLSTEENLNYDSDSSSPETTSTSSASLVLVGCSRCILYVMLSELDLTCPRCRSSNLHRFRRRPFGNSTNPV